MTVADDLATLRDDHIDTGIALGHIDNVVCLPACVVCAALDRVEAEIARLERLLREEQKATDDSATQRYRAEAAEAEAARLRDGLREMVKLADGHPARLATYHGWKEIARALLSEDGAPPLSDADYRRAANDMPEKLAEDGAA